MPAVMYGSETWGMRREEKSKVDASAMQCL